MIRAFLPLGLLLTTLALSSPMRQTAPAAEGTLLTAAVAWSGPKSAIEQPSYRRMVKQNDLLRCWYEHLGVHPKNGTRHDRKVDPVIPEVDFEHYMVIGIFTGETYNSTGVVLHDVTLTDDELVVRFDEATYQTASTVQGGEDGEEVMARLEEEGRVTPFGLFVLPRSTKPVVFVENVQGLLGHPPKWKERHRLEAVTK